MRSIDYWCSTIKHYSVDKYMYTICQQGECVCRVFVNHGGSSSCPHSTCMYSLFRTVTGPRGAVSHGALTVV